MVAAPVRSFTFAVECPACAGPLTYDHAADSYEAVRRSVAVCERCDRRWVYTVTVRQEVGA